MVRHDGTYANDSTPLIRELEIAFPTARQCTLQDNALRFLDSLLEDFADEWLTKPMFAGRFHTDTDAIFGASWQILSSALLASVPGSFDAAKAFARRQQGRQGLVGCRDWKLMETTMRRVCEALQANLQSGHQVKRHFMEKGSG